VAWCRAGPRHVGTQGRLIIWSPSNFFSLGPGLRIFLRASAQIADNFLGSFVCGKFECTSTILSIIPVTFWRPGRLALAGRILLFLKMLSSAFIPTLLSLMSHHRPSSMFVPQPRKEIAEYETAQSFTLSDCCCVPAYTLTCR
jgi:hypothetical protein